MSAIPLAPVQQQPTCSQPASQPPTHTHKQAPSAAQPHLHLLFGGVGRLLDGVGSILGPHRQPVQCRATAGSAGGSGAGLAGQGTSALSFLLHRVWCGWMWVEFCAPGYDACSSRLKVVRVRPSQLEATADSSAAVGAGSSRQHQYTPGGGVTHACLAVQR